MATQLADQQIAPADASTQDTSATALQDQMYPDDTRSAENDTGATEQVEDVENQGQEQQEQDPVVEQVNAPHSWNAEDKAIFATLSPEAQAIINRRETERDAFVRQKGEEVVQVRRQVENEARTIVQQLHQNSAQQFQTLATQVQAFLPQPPDDRLLWSSNPGDVQVYHQQKALYDHGVAQYQQVQQQVEAARQQAALMEQQATQQEIERGNATLAEQLGTDWTDPSKRKLLLDSLEPIGRELGYADRMGAADATDILALKNIAAWKVKADKFDALQKAKMTDVRAHKGIPRIAQPGSTASTPNQDVDVTRTLYPNDPPRR